MSVSVFEINALVEDAVVSDSTVPVAAAKSKFSKCEVDEAKRPDCAQMGEVVPAVITA